MSESTKQRIPLITIKACKRCGDIPFMRREYNLFEAPGDLMTVFYCPTCGTIVKEYSDEEAIETWNKVQEE